MSQKILFTFFLMVNVCSSLYANELKVCFVGDLGPANKEQAWVIDKLMEQKCDQVRIVGDIVYNDGIEDIDDPQLKTKFLDPFKKLLTTTPVYLVAGNHDYHEDPEAWLEVAKKYKNVKMPNMYYFEKFSKVCFMAFDTTPFHKLRLYFTRKRQESWVLKKLKALKECNISIGWGHHPFRSSGGHGDASGSWKDFFKDYLLGKLDYFVAGHDHILSDEGEHGGTHHFVSGGGGKSKYGFKRKIKGRFQKSAIGFLVMNFDLDESKLKEYFFVSK